MSGPVVSEPSSKRGRVMELRREACTMALYVAICLLASLIALHGDGLHINVLGVIWGVSVGLALAHWFAFRVAARLVGAGTVRPDDVQSAAVQLVGAAVVALLASFPVILLPESVEVRIVLLLLATFIGVVGYVVSRGGGATRRRALAYGLSVLVIAVAVAEVKNALAGH